MRLLRGRAPPVTLDTLTPPEPERMTAETDTVNAALMAPAHRLPDIQFDAIRGPMVSPATFRETQAIR